MSMPNPNFYVSVIQPPPISTRLDAQDPENFGIPVDLRGQPGIAGLHPAWAQFFEQMYQRVAAGPVIQDTHANRANYSASQYPGLVYYETDRTVFYLSTMVSGAWAWVYAAGTMKCEQSGLPVDLGANDRYFIANVTDYRHKLIWGNEDPTGAYSAGWDFESGDGGSNLFVDTGGSAPAGKGWHACDGSTVNYLESNGSLGSVTLPNCASTPNYSKAGASYTGASGVTAANAPTLSGSTATGNANIGNNSAPAAAGSSGTGAAANPHTHTDSGHTHGVGTLAISASGEPAHVTYTRYFRQ